MMKTQENSNLSSVARCRSIIETSELREIIADCSANLLFSHRHTDALVKLLAVHSFKDPELLSIADIAAEMGVAESSLIHPDSGDDNCSISHVYEEEHAIYGSAPAFNGLAPMAVHNRAGSTHRRPRVSVHKLSGWGLYVGFYRDLPLVVRRADGRMVAPYRILPNNHQMINLIGGLPSEALDYVVREVENAVFIGDSFAFTNYAHWTLDWFPRLKWIIKEHGSASDLSIVFNRKPMPFHFQMLETVGFRRENIIYPDSSVPTYFVKANNVIATNIGREFRHSCHAGASWAIDFLRKELYEASKSPFSPGIRLVITRDQRGIDFSEAALATLKDKGFIFVKPELMNHAEQVALFANAAAVIAPHGAGLSNLVFCSPGTYVLELFNNTLATHAFYTIAHFGDLNYSCVMKESENIPSSDKPIDRNCYVDEEILQPWLMSANI